MVSDDDIDGFRDELASTGKVVVTDPRGRKLFLVLSTTLGMDPAGILVAYEREGTFYFTLDRPLNPFRLIENGFSLMVAPTVSALVNALLQPRMDGARSRETPRLAAPKGYGDGHDD